MAIRPTADGGPAGPFSTGSFPRAVPSLPPVADTSGPFGGSGSMGSTFSPHPSAPPPMGAPVQSAAEAPQQAPFGPSRPSPTDQQGPTSTDLSQGQSSGGPAPAPAPANGLALNKERVVLILALAGLVVLAYMLWMRKGKGRRR